MNNKEIKAIFLDVDGTLISFRTHEIPQSTLEALRRAHERGVKLFVATGRAAGDLEPLAGIPYDGVAAFNGARCVNADGSVVHARRILQADFDRAMELSEELGFPLGLELENGVFVNRITPVVEEVARLVAHPVPVETDLRALFNSTECCQMCFYFDPEQERRVMAQLPGLSAARWCPQFADINVAGTNKAQGMKPFLERYGFTMDEAMAFGDGGNDVEMLREAGVGVAMGNGCAEALAAADHITAEVDDHGIRRALEHFKVI